MDSEKIAGFLTLGWHGCRPPKDLPLHTVWTCPDCEHVFCKEEEGPGLWREIEPYE